MTEPLHKSDVAGTTWDPNQYLKFADHRLRPALELLNRIPLDAPGVVYDVGCGSGNVTRLIAERWPAATVYGMDNSLEMLGKAAATPSDIRWVEGDVRTWTPPETPDVLYSNAALQWVDDHDQVFPHLLSLLPAGACLAVQMPLSWGMTSHRLMRDTLADGGPGGSPLGTEALRVAMARKWVEDADVYYDWLAPKVRHLDIWETEYVQVLQGEDPVLEWVTSTGLRPILNGLDDADRAVYLDAYRQRLRDAYPMRADGHTLYPFRRLFIVAVV
jgi:trans-aconitate 2-methyltransferase